GDAPTSGLSTLTINLPAGITRDSYRLDVYTFQGTETEWKCPGAPGDSTVTCTTSTPIGSGWDDRNLILTVDVAPNASPDVVATAQIAGGGAPEAPPVAECALGA